MAVNFLKVSKEHSKQHYADFKDRPSEGPVHRTSCDNCLGRAECGEDKVGSLVLNWQEHYLWHFSLKMIMKHFHGGLSPSTIVSFLTILFMDQMLF